MKKPAAIKKTGRARIRVDVELPVGFRRHRLHSGNQMPAVPRAVAKATDGGVLQLGDFPSIMAENQVDFHPAEQAVAFGGWHRREARLDGVRVVLLLRI